MPKKPRVRTLIYSQHVKGSETLLKLAWQCFSRIFWSVWTKIPSEDSVQLVPEKLRLFVNILTPEEKYSLYVKAIV